VAFFQLVSAFPFTYGSCGRKEHSKAKTFEYYSMVFLPVDSEEFEEVKKTEFQRS
jgi:hypothetical protein